MDLRKECKKAFHNIHWYINHVTQEKRDKYIDSIILLQKLSGTDINFTTTNESWRQIWLAIHKLPDNKVKQLYKAI